MHVSCWGRAHRLPCLAGRAGPNSILHGMRAVRRWLALCLTAGRDAHVVARGAHLSSVWRVAICTRAGGGETLAGPGLDGMAACAHAVHPCMDHDVWLCSCSCCAHLTTLHHQCCGDVAASMRLVPIESPKQHLCYQCLLLLPAQLAKPRCASLTDSSMPAAQALAASTQCSRRSACALHASAHQPTASRSHCSRTAQLQLRCMPRPQAAGRRPRRLHRQCTFSTRRQRRQRQLLPAAQRRPCGGCRLSALARRTP